MKKLDRVTSIDMANMILSAFNTETIRIATRFNNGKYDNYIRLLDSVMGADDEESGINGLYPYMEDNFDQYVLVYGGTKKYPEPIYDIRDTYLNVSVCYLFVDNIKDLSIDKLYIFIESLDLDLASLMALMIGYPSILDRMRQFRDTDIVSKEPLIKSSFDWVIDFYDRIENQYTLDQIGVLCSYHKETRREYESFKGILESIYYRTKEIDEI